MSERSAVVAGATGLTGGYCLRLLLEDEDYAQVTTITRRPISLQHDKLTQRVLDFERLDEVADALAVNDVFCCLGTTLLKAGSHAAFARVDYGFVKWLAELAAEAGARQFLLISAIGANHFSPIFYNRTKRRAEDAVRALPFASVHIMRPALLLGHRREARPIEDFIKLFSPYMSLALWGPLQRYRPVHAETVAEQMIRLAKLDQSGVHVHPVSAYE